MYNKLSEKVLVFLTALLMIVLNSCSMGTTEGENVTDNTRYAIEELICESHRQKAWVIRSEEAWA